MPRSRSKPMLISQPVLASASNMLHDTRFGANAGLAAPRALPHSAHSPTFNADALARFEGLSINTDRADSTHVPMPWLPVPPRECRTPINRTRTPLTETPTARSFTSALTPRAPAKPHRYHAPSLLDSPCFTRPLDLCSIALEHADADPGPEAEQELESRWSSSEDEDDSDDDDSALSWLSRSRSRAASVTSSGKTHSRTPSLRSQAASAAMKSSASLRSFCSGNIGASRSVTPLPPMPQERDSPEQGAPGRRRSRLLSNIKMHITPRKSKPPTSRAPPPPHDRHIPDTLSLPSRLLRPKPSATSSSSAAQPPLRLSPLPKLHLRRSRMPDFHPPAAPPALLQPLPSPKPNPNTPVRPRRPSGVLLFGAADSGESVRATTMKTSTAPSSNNTSSSRGAGRLLPALPMSSEATSMGARTNTVSVRAHQSSASESCLFREGQHPNTTNHDRNSDSNMFHPNPMYLHDNANVESLLPPAFGQRSVTAPDVLMRGDFAPPPKRTSSRPASPGFASRHGKLHFPARGDFDFAPPPRISSRGTSSGSPVSSPPPVCDFTPQTSPNAPSLSHETSSSISSMSSLSSTGSDFDLENDLDLDRDLDSAGARYRLHIGEPIPPAPLSGMAARPVSMIPPPSPRSDTRTPSPGGLPCPRRGVNVTPKREVTRDEDVPLHLTRAPSLTREAGSVPKEGEGGMYLAQNASTHTFGEGSLDIDFSSPSEW